MKHLKKAVAAALTVCVCASLLAGCGTQTKTVYELPYYDGSTVSDVTGLTEYNEDLWRRNSQILASADPFILDNTAEDGYYYLYMTSDGFYTYRTKDFCEWEPVGKVLELVPGWTSYWAPEVAVEENAEGELIYYLFFSLCPPEHQGSPYEKVPLLATSTSPSGPFEIVDFTDPESCEGNTHDNGLLTSYSDWAFIDYEKMCEALNEQMGTSFSPTSIPSLIDTHPFVTEDGEKYLYYSLEDPRAIVGMKMNNWYSIDYDSVTVLTRVGYYSMEDYEKAQNGEEVDICEYEEMGTAPVNEGAFVTEHNGLFYLTFSINGFGDPAYSVMQAVGESPLGPFTKLKDDQNGLILSMDLGANAAVSGTGHHCFFTIGDNMYIAYHRMMIKDTIEGGRGLCVDEVKWVETEKDGEKLDVLYVNGPTTTIQPRFDPEAEYVTIAEEGTVTLVSGELTDGSAENLNDGLLSYNTMVNQEFLNTYVKEATANENVTFEISFEETREVCAVLFYGSKYMDRYYGSIRDIEIVTEENGAEKTYYIEELVPDGTCIAWNEDELAAGNYVMENIIYGSGAYAEFAPLNVKSIRFTVTVAEGQETLGVSEIAVLGKRA